MLGERIQHENNDPWLNVWIVLSKVFSFFVYGILKKITQFWLVESNTIKPKLYFVGVPIKFPWKQRVSGFLMALFLPKKELFTNFVMFNHAWKHEVGVWNYFHCDTKPNLQVATILAWFWWLCYHVNWKNYIILLQFVILLNVL